MTDPPSPANEHPLSPGAVVAGYRLVRRISLDTGTAGWLAKTIDGNETVSISLHRETDAVTRRVRAHAALRSPHVLALRDLASDGDGCIVLVCERTEWTLAALLAARVRLAAGEAVTILAPLVSGLSALREAGFVHGHLTAATVLFSPDGRPVIGGLEFLREREVETTSIVLSDVRALAALISLVGEAVDEPARDGFLDVRSWLIESLSDDEEPAGLLGQLECRLFALAEGLPVVLGADRKAPQIDGDARAPFSVTSARRAAGALPTTARILAAMLRSGIGGWAARAVRGRALAACVGIVVLTGSLMAGLTLVPEASPAAPAPRRSVPSSSPPLVTPPSPRASVPGNAEPALVGDDVVAATAALLARRADCLGGGSTGCVPGYAEGGSALADADSHRAAEAGVDGLLIAEETRKRIEQLQAYGDAVLLRVLGADEKRQPVLVLTVRTDTGWRLRDVFEPD
ncbi:hypothetical protein D9V29_08085 [Mycetocola manganoxydans]|uniref:S1 motif domain-containing protein n=1 Tax=Mycetocola manganoxydans TaxID=699879 RepID=A0A3L6ZW44_9MICO|nr:hypothetical protein [Mycetocola manganoxydans]RLP71791.1 hypothetical protein D9V29_08085 [Mycetocola manganoxydans]GHD39606.1 hypothetical protein GCM10008097_02480 [Mycetocola manganoxydans]